MSPLPLARIPYLILLAATLGCGEEAREPTAPDMAAASSALTFRRLASSGTHTCAVTTDNRAYCWGLIGEIVSGDLTRPNAVATGLRFLEVHAGIRFSCGLTTDNRIYCWGDNTDGQLGNGSTSQFSAVPVALAGGRRFRLVRAGAGHACGITLAGVTFCWGLNEQGQLGDGTKTNRRAPVRVVGGITFQRLSAGNFHNCGVTAENKAYCWGKNDRGQLGDRTSTTRLKPVPVFGGLAFSVIGAGGAHTCGVTTDHIGYCWGLNTSGQLGDGTTDRHGRPLPVAGGLSFSGISAGLTHSCGVTTGKRAYCWGYNFFGQLGEGTNATEDPFILRRLNPVAVKGGLLFNSVIAAKGLYTCAITTDDLGYCWGENTAGYLGDGTKTDRSAPVPVAPPG